MDHELLRTWGPRLAVLAAVVACLQIGLVRVERSDRVGDLESRLAVLERDSQRTAAHLGRQLRLARVQSQQLRSRLARSREQNSDLDLQLAEANASAAASRQEAESATATLRTEPPPIGVRVAAADPPDGFVAVAENVGSSSVRIVETQGRLWIGGREELVGGGVLDLAVGPGEEIDFFEFGLLGAEAVLVADGAVDVRGALCIVYERTADANPAAWASELWFEYRPKLHDTAILRQDRWAPSPDEVACDLEVAASPW